MLSFSLAEKTALVSGASRGIGQAIAMTLGKQGAKVIGTATTEQGADNISARLEAAGIEGKGLVLNVSDKDAIEHVASILKAEDSFPDILVNNAAITRDNIMLRMKDDEWLDVMNTNLNSIFYMTKLYLKSMVKKRWGRIINLSSLVAATGNLGQANYAATKAALLGFSKSLAQEIAMRHVTVNAVAPGFIKSDMTDAIPEEHRNKLMEKIPAGALGTPEDIAATVAFLASPAAQYITGQCIHVNGGMYM